MSLARLPFVLPYILHITLLLVDRQHISRVIVLGLTFLRVAPKELAPALNPLSKLVL